MSLFESEFEEHMAVAAATRAALGPAFRRMLDAWVACIRGGGKILFFGNGGSASDAQHLATELTIRYAKDRAPIAAIALTTDTSAITAAGNDMGFERIFARQIEALGRKGDLAFGITTSGRSPNVIAGSGDGEEDGPRGRRACRAAREGSCPGSPIPCCWSPPGPRRESRRCISPWARCSAPGSSRSWVWYECGSNPRRAAWPRPASWSSAM